MSTAKVEGQQGQSCSEAISQLMAAELLESAKPPILQGEYWHRAQTRLPGCFPDMCEICSSHDRQYFSRLFQPVIEEILYLKSRGLLCFMTCLKAICQIIPLPQDPQFEVCVAAAAKRNGISPESVGVLRAIRFLTIAVDIGLIRLI